MRAVWRPRPVEITNGRMSRVLFAQYTTRYHAMPAHITTQYPPKKTTHTLANTHAFPPDAVFRLPLPLRLKPIAAILSRFAAHARLRSIPPNGGCGVRFASRPSDGVLRPAPFRLPPVRTYIELPGAHPPGGSAKRAHAGKPSCAPWVALFTFRPPGQNYMRSMVQPGEPHDTA